MSVVMAVPGKIRLLLDSIRFEHTVFALPFAYLGMILASDGLPTLAPFLWITVAMASARTLAMSANRIIDRRLDAQNPRTAARPLPAGRIRLWEMTAMSVVSLGVFLLAAAMLNTLALALAPVAAVVVVGYSYTKRFTWTSHFVLGWADGIAPAGGWIAVTGSLTWEPVLMAFAVATWIGGFDILYACQDRDFDLQRGLHSIPQKFGIPAALMWAKGMHVPHRRVPPGDRALDGVGVPLLHRLGAGCGPPGVRAPAGLPHRPVQAQHGLLQHQRLHCRHHIRVYLCVHIRVALRG